MTYELSHTTKQQQRHTEDLILDEFSIYLDLIAYFHGFTLGPVLLKSLILPTQTSFHTYIFLEEWDIVNTSINMLNGSNIDNI